MRLNGIGIALLGIKRQKQSNRATGTDWFTFLFLPIFPIARFEIEIVADQQYKILRRTSLNIREIIRTYAIGLLALPLIGLGPVLLGTREIWEALGIPKQYDLPYILTGIAWFVGVFLAVLFGYEKQLKRNP